MMVTDPILESGMTFGPFPAPGCFRVEKCSARQNMKKPVKSVEFILMRNREMWLVEAKSLGYVEGLDVIEKFCSSLLLFLTKKIGRLDGDHGMEVYAQTDLSSLPIKFILVIRELPLYKCTAMQESLNKKLKDNSFGKLFFAMFDCKIYVFNDQKAHEIGLVGG